MLWDFYHLYYSYNLVFYIKIEYWWQKNVQINIHSVCSSSFLNFFYWCSSTTLVFWTNKGHASWSNAMRFLLLILYIQFSLIHQKLSTSDHKKVQINIHSVCSSRYGIYCFGHAPCTNAMIFFITNVIYIIWFITSTLDTGDDT